jgi:hypothetical protein
MALGEHDGMEDTYYINVKLHYTHTHTHTHTHTKPCIHIIHIGMDGNYTLELIFKYILKKYSGSHSLIHIMSKNCSSFEHVQNRLIKIY